MKIAQRDPTGHPRFAGPFALVILAILAGGLAYSRYETNLIRQEEYRNLAVIAELKARQITECGQERFLHVTRTSHGPFLREAIADFIKAPGNPDLASDLRKKFELEQKGHSYADDPRFGFLKALLEKSHIVTFMQPSSPVCRVWGGVTTINCLQRKAARF